MRNHNRENRLTLILLAILLLFFFMVAVLKTVIIPPEMARAFKATKTLYYVYEYLNPFGDKTKGWKRVDMVYLGDGVFLSVYHIGRDVPGGGKFTSDLPYGEKIKKMSLYPIKHDILNDLALFKIDGSFPDLPAIWLAEDFTIGEDIMFIGHSTNEMPEIRFGKIAYKDEKGILFHPVFYGDSGGPLLNMKGELLGMISKPWDGLTDRAMVGLAIPLEKIREFLNEKK